MNTPPRILIVEDDAVLAAELQETLTQLGYQVIGPAATGNAAVESALAQKPDVILMDIRLRGAMTGIQAVDQIHQQLDIPVVYLTAFADEALLQQAKITDVYAYLVKPVRDRELRAVLEMALYKHAAEQRLQHLNQILRAVRDVNQLIIREHDAQHLMDDACQILLRTHSYQFVWIGESAGDRLKPRASAGDGQTLLAHIVASATPEQGLKLPGTQASITRHVVVCHDMLHDERYAPWREEVEQAHFSSTVAVPIFHEENLFGVLSVYSDQTNIFGAEEIDLLLEMAGDIAFGLKAIDLEAEQKRAEIALRASEERLRQVINLVPHFIFAKDINGKFILANEAVANVYGTTVEDLIGKSDADFDPNTAEVEHFLAEDRMVIESGISKPNVEETITDSKGERRILDTTKIPFTASGTKLPSVLGVSVDITERQLAAETLRASEVRYRELFNNANLAIFQSALDGTVLAVNPEFVRMFGFASPAEVAATVSNAADIFADPKRREEIIRLKAENPDLSTFESLYRRKDGSTFIGKLNVRQVVDSNNNRQPFFEGFVEDITERKRAEEALQSTTLRLTALLENMQTGILFEDSTRHVVLNNQTFCDLFSIPLPPHTLLGADYRQAVQSAKYLMSDPEGFAQQIEIIVDKNRLVVNEELSLADGRTFERNYIPISVDNDQAGHLWQYRDITERKQTEAALRESEEKFKTLFNTANDAIFTLSHTTFLYCNATTEKIFRGSREQIIGRSPVDFSPERQPDGSFSNQSVVAKIEAAFAGQPQVFEWLHIRLDGIPFYAEVSLNRVFIGGEFILQSIVRDVTERKRAELQREVLYQILRTVSNQLDLELVVHSAVETIVRLTGYPHICIVLPDEDGAHWVVRGAAGSLAAELGAMYPIDQGVIGRAFNTGQTQWVRDILDDPSYVRDVNTADAPALRSELVVPVYHGDRLLGALNVESDRVDAFDDADAGMIQSLADAISLALENARLYREAQQEIAERKRTEEALQESEKKYRELFEVNKDGIAIFMVNPHSPPSTFVEVNDTAPKMLGYTRDEMLKLTPLMLEPNLTPAQSQFRQSEFASKGVSNFETVIQHKDGHPVFTEFSAQLIQYEGKPAIMNIVRDITERKRAEEALRESEERLKEAQRIAFIGNWDLNLVNNNLIWSDEIYRIFEIDPAKFGASYDAFLGAIHPDDRDTVNKAYTSSLETRIPYEIDHRLLMPNGSEKYVHERCETFYDADGHPTHSIGTVQDITERKQRENELQTIATLSKVLRTAETRAEILSVIVEQLSDLLHCDSISAEIIDPTTQEAVVEAAHGVWTTFIGLRQPLGMGLNAIIYETRRPYYNNNLDNAPPASIPISVMEGMLAGVGAPLFAQDQLIGFLWMGRKTEIAESEVRLLVAIADIAANAIHRATLHEQTLKDAADLALAYDKTLEGWVHALELRDQETEGHTRRVTQMTVDLARAMKIGEDELEHIRRGALLHDIGKMGIPDSILLKPGALDEHEWAIMRQHPEYAYKLLEPIQYLRPVLDIPYIHHEKWDGSGYPHGLKGEEIPLAARIFAIVDVWDALTSDRPYRAAWLKEKALAHIAEQSGKHFDPAVIEAFLKII